MRCLLKHSGDEIHSTANQICTFHNGHDIYRLTLSLLSVESTDNYCTPNHSH